MSPKINLAFYRVILFSGLSSLDSFSVIAQFISPCKHVAMTYSCLYIKYITCHIRISFQHKLFPYRCITVLVIIDLDHSSFFRLYSDSLQDIPTSAKWEVVVYMFHRPSSAVFAVAPMSRMDFWVVIFGAWNPLLPGQYHILGWYGCSQ